MTTAILPKLQLSPASRQQRIALTFLSSGLIASLVAQVIAGQWRLTHIHEINMFAEIARYNLERMPSVFYVIHGIEVGCMALAAFYGFISPEGNRLRRNFPRWTLAFYLYLACGLITTARTYTLDLWLSGKAFHPSGVAGQAVIGLVFAVLTDRAWKRIRLYFMAFTGILSALTVYTLVAAPMATRDQAAQTLNPYLTSLFWLSVWVFLDSALTRRALGQVYRFVPFFVYCSASVVALTRAFIGNVVVL